MDVWDWLSFYPHTWQALRRALARGIWFDAAHATGNFVLALVAGPELRRMLERYAPSAADGGRVGLKLATLAVALASPRHAGRLLAAHQAAERRLRRAGRHAGPQLTAWAALGLGGRATGQRRSIYLARTAAG